jgi:hypothetical protein
VFADLDPLDVGIDRLELTADFDWGFGFGVEGFEVGWTSIHPNQDAAGGLFVRRHARRRGLAQLQQVRETAAG